MVSSNDSQRSHGQNQDEPSNIVPLVRIGPGGDFVQHVYADGSDGFDAAVSRLVRIGVRVRHAVVLVNDHGPAAVQAGLDGAQYVNTLRGVALHMHVAGLRMVLLLRVEQGFASVGKYPIPPLAVPMSATPTPPPTKTTLGIVTARLRRAASRLHSASLAAAHGFRLLCRTRDRSAT